MKKYFKLYSNCIVVEGAKNKIICDLYLNQYLNIPEFVCTIFTIYKKLSIKQLQEKFGKSQMIPVLDYFNFLKAEGYGFYTDFPAYFPELNLDYDTPEMISNSILDYDKQEKYNIHDAILKLDHLRCTALQIRFFDELTLNEFEKILDTVQKTNINTVEVLVKQLLFKNLNQVENLLIKYFKLRKLFLFNQPYIETKQVSTDSADFGFILTSTDDLKSADQCGYISVNMFHSNIHSFSEAKNFNSCLNKKLSIDVNGDIKNCPSLKTSFGKIKNVKDLSIIANNKEFQKKWFINKDKIKVCKDCEFRYICTDCRAFITDEKDQYSKPSRCGYDPYSGVWSERKRLN